MSKQRKKRIKKFHFKSEKDLPLCSVSLGTTLTNKTGSWRSVRPVIDLSNCISCMICWKFCPEPAILIKDGKPVIDYDYCKGCGICIEVCPKKCIKFKKEKK